MQAQAQGDEASIIGSVFASRFRLLEVIGDGGMGRVYRAEELGPGKPVAVKLLHPEFAGVDQVVLRFEREAAVMKELSHPSITRVIEFGECNGRLYLAMELLSGKALAEMIGDGIKTGRPLSIKRTIAIMSPAFDALDYAHGRGVVHRDLKPENIMVIGGGLLSRESIKLLDFGIAKLGEASERSSQKLTMHGLVLGTPGYMSPEQAAGMPADARSDIYSCGVILYQMLTGRQPFVAEAPFEVLQMHLNTQPPAMRDVAVGAWIPDAVENVVLRAMAKRPAERFQSARELRQALEHAAVIDYGHTGAGKEPSRKGLSPGARFLCLAIMVGGATAVLGHHLRAKKAAAAANAAAAADAAAAAAARPAPPADRDEGAPSEIAEEAPERPKHAARPARHASKKHAARKHRH